MTGADTYSTGYQLPILRKLYFEPVSTFPGVFVTTQESKGSRYVGRSLFGWIGLQSVGQITEDGRRSHMLTNALAMTGDWKNMHTGSSLSFDQEFSYQFAVTGMRASSKIRQHCQVESVLSARELHPDLSGNAKRLHCTLSKEVVPSEVAYYLQDYGLVVLLERTSTVNGNVTVSQRLSITRVNAEN